MNKKYVGYKHELTDTYIIFEINSNDINITNNSILDCAGYYGLDIEANNISTINSINTSDNVYTVKNKSIIYTDAGSSGEVTNENSDVFIA